MVEFAKKKRKKNKKDEDLQKQLNKKKIRQLLQETKSSITVTSERPSKITKKNDVEKQGKFLKRSQTGIIKDANGQYLTGRSNADGKSIQVVLDL